MESHMKDKLVIKFGGEPIGLLNEDMIFAQNVTKTGIEKLKKLHIQRHILFLLAAKSQDDSTLLHNLASELETIEFDMQKAWKFEPNRNFHSWWNQIPGCSCPKIDNLDTYGTDLRYMNGNCPVHN